MMNPQWPTYMLEDCMEAIIDYRGKTPKKTTFGIPLITAKIIKKGTILPVEEYISPDDYNEWMRRGLPKQGDVVLTTEAPLGEVAQLQNSKVALAQRVVTLRGKNGFLDNTFLKYLLLDNSVQNLLKSKSTGTTVTGIKQRELRKIKLSFPPFSEQQAIAHILGTLDDKIKLNRRQNATLEAMAQATFKDWFVDFGPVRAKMEGRQLECMSREIADLFPDRLDGEGKPEGWGWKPLSCFFELLGGGTPKTSVDEYWNGEIPWFSVVDTPSGSDLFVVKTQKNITKYGFENSSVKIVPQNCTIITARGTVGKLALTGVPMTINQSCYAAKASKYIGNFFIYFLLRKSISHLESNAHGSVFSTITRSTFETIYSDYPTESLCITFEESAFPLMEKVKKNEGAN